MPQKVGIKVVHVSGQDENFKASELNHHSPLTKGWQSSRFCLYPQDIVVLLDKRSRLRKIQILAHQFLVATKIEFYVGDVPDDTPITLQNARYTRLGYVSLSDNEKTGFKARELKSVHVDAVGVFLKLVIHKNHINKFNLYNQVGIVAVNVIGDPLDKKNVLDTDLYSDAEQPNTSDSLNGTYNRPDYISPLDDLAFDMYQDPEIGQIIKKLDRKKQEAVLQERYDFAKRLKEAIAGLQKVGEKLGKMEIEKRQAVENEDYDKAKLKKVQMDEYRLMVYQELQIDALLEMYGSRHPKPVDLSTPRQPTPPRLMEINSSPPSQQSTPRTPYDERPLPALKSKEYPKDPTPPPPQVSSEDLSPSNIPVQDLEPDSELTDPEVDEDPSGENVGGATEPEPMTERDLRDASSVIDMFGKLLVSKAYSKMWSFREDALLALYKELKDMPPSTPKEEAKASLRAAIFLIKRAIDDKVFAVYKAGLNLERMLLTDFVPAHKIPRHDVMHAVEKTLSNLLHKSGDMASRNRDMAKDFILEMSKYREVKPTHVVPVECVKPFKLSIAPRLSLSRTELMELLYAEHGLDDSSLSVDSLMRFTVQALQHNSGEVREVAERIIKTLYEEVGSPVKDYLPPDDEKTRKNTLYRMLFEHFDKVDGKPSKSDFKKSKAEVEAKKQAEIAALQSQLQQLKDMAAGKAPLNEDLLKDDKKKKEKPPVLSTRLSNSTLSKVDLHKKESNKKLTPANNKPPQTNKANKPSPAEKDDDASTIFNVDLEAAENTCIFCAERNEGFTEEALDVHYWKSCPMLKRCANCKQVVEIAGYTEHLLTECDANGNYKLDPRCSEAIPISEFDQHVAEKTCNPVAPNTNHCPLCHENFSAGEDGWKNHLMKKDGCKQNPRRLLSLNKPAQGKGGAAPPSKSKGRSSIPKPAQGKGKSDPMLSQLQQVTERARRNMNDVSKQDKNLLHTEERLVQMNEAEKDLKQIKKQEDIIQEMKTSKTYSVLRLKDTEQQLEALRTSVELRKPESLECKNATRVLDDIKQYLASVDAENA